MTRFLWYFPGIVFALTLCHLNPLNAQWVSIGPGGGNVRILYVNGSNLYAGTDGAGVFLSTNSGASWSSISTGLPLSLDYSPVYAVTVSGPNLVAGLYGYGVYISSDNGASWSASSTGMTSGFIHSFASIGSNLFAGTFGGGVDISTDNGATWAYAGTGLPNYIVSVASSGSNLLAATYGNGVWISTNNGTSWTSTSFPSAYAISLLTNGATIYCGAYNGIWTSTNSGSNWTAIKNNLPSSYVYALAQSGGYLLAGMDGAGVYASTNNGANWSAANTNLTNQTIRTFVMIGSNLYAGTLGGGVFVTNNNGGSWSPSSNGLSSSTISALGAAGSSIFCGTHGVGFSLSTNNGASWSAISGLGTASDSITAFAVLGASVYAGTSSRGVYRSTNNGTSWTAVNNGLTTVYVYSLLAVGTNIFAGMAGGIFVSPNGGANWTLGTGEPLSGIYVSLAGLGTSVFAADKHNNDVYKSTDNGITWSALHSSISSPYSLTATATNVYAGSYGYGVYVSTDNGTSWGTAAGGPLDGYVNALATDGTAIYAGTDFGVYCLPSSSGSWGPVNTGLTLKVTSCLVTGGSLFAGTAGGGVGKRALTELSVGPSSNEVPAQFSLSQNYPNPFNPSTTIKFELPKSSTVRLSVFDMLGREVSVLVNDKRNAGDYEVKFDGSNLASGVYFYRLKAGSFVQTRKLLVLR
jgi:hypothetical protein